MPALLVRHRKLFSFTLIWLMTASLVFIPGPVLAASNVVGNGTAVSCTPTAFDNAYYALEGSSGGKITFSCGPAPVTIILAFQHTISADLEIDGGNLVTLSGGNATMLFQVFSGHSLTLNQVTLSHGYGSFGAVENFGTLNATNSQFLNNEALDFGGGILNYDTLNLTDDLFDNNKAGSNGGGVFTTGGTATLSHVAFSNNTAFSGGGGIGVDINAIVVIDSSLFTGNQATDTFAQGGAIDNIAGALTINKSTFFNNFSSRGGGVSALGGTTAITQSAYTGNYSAYGGAIRQEGGTLTVTDVTFSGNGYAPNGYQVNTGGGAVSFGGGDATLTNVTINGNWASYGGGFDHAGTGTATLTNVTISNNNAVGSGAFDQADGSVVLVNVTISDNSAPFYGGVGNRLGTLSVRNTLLTGNMNTTTHQSENCYLTIANNSFSMSSDATCGFGAGHDNLTLPIGPLASNGGYTQTILLKKGNPAIDGGTDANCPTTDQRYVPRPIGPACDVGAVEMAPADFGLMAFLPVIRK